MATSKDYQLVNHLIQQTAERQIKWEPTATEMQFATTLKGKYVITVDKTFSRVSQPSYWMTMTDSSGREMLRLTHSDMGQVSTLYDQIERVALNVDAAIDEIVGDGGILS